MQTSEKRLSRQIAYMAWQLLIQSIDGGEANPLVVTLVWAISRNSSKISWNEFAGIIFKHLDSTEGQRLKST